MTELAPCPLCRQENPSGNRFCGSCGERSVCSSPRGRPVGEGKKAFSLPLDRSITPIGTEVAARAGSILCRLRLLASLTDIGIAVGRNRVSSSVVMHAV